MKKFKPEMLLNQRNGGVFGGEPEPNATRLLIIMLVVFMLMSTILLMGSLELGDVVIEETVQKKKKLEYSTLALFYVNIFFALNSLFSGGFAAITDADILDAVKGVTSAQSVQYSLYVRSN